MPVAFTQELRAKFADQKYLDEVERLYKRVTTLRMGQVDPDQSPIAKMPAKVIVVLQVGLRRILELTESFIADVNAGLFTPPFVTARAVVETACLLRRVVQRVREITGAHDLAALKDLDPWLMRVLMGGKSSEWTHADEYEAINVLSVIKQLSDEMPHLLSMYELLSEYAHPNYKGMMGVYQGIKGGASVFIDHPADAHRDEMKTAVGMVGFGLLLIERGEAQYRGVLPAFIRLCEEQIHKGGTWPADVPFPRQAK